jgi:HEPN superfamily protein
MKIDDVRAELEEDLTWRLDEIRHLRNDLLSGLDSQDWPARAMRPILVMQYAHLEGFARNAFSIYVTTINKLRLRATDAHPHLFASALTREFDAIRGGLSAASEPEDGRLMRRAKAQVAFVEQVRTLNEGELVVNAETAVSMEMNFGADVLRRTLYRLGIPETDVGRSYYRSLEFVRTMRNDIAHGSRRERIPAQQFEEHQRQCEEFMNELVRLVTSAIRSELFRKLPSSGVGS